jgi:hypothetical protein
VNLTCSGTSLYGPSPGPRAAGLEGSEDISWILYFQLAQVKARYKQLWRVLDLFPGGLLAPLGEQLHNLAFDTTESLIPSILYQFFGAE